MREHRTRLTSDSLTTIDRIAGESRFRRVSAGLKSALAVSLIISVVGFRSLWANLFVLLGMITLALMGGVSLRIYLRIMRVPLIFLCMSGIVMLFDFSAAATGLLSIPLLGGWVVVTPDSLNTTVKVLLTALSAVSVLNALSLSTPLPDLIRVARRARLPDILIELMFLMYRFVFIFGRTLSQMRVAAAARVGFFGTRNSLRSAGGIMTQLLLVSFRRASFLYDAMEARCYNGSISFLPAEHETSAGTVAFCAIYLLATLLIGGADLLLR